MRWVYWLLGIAGVLQYAILAIAKPDGYVSLDTAYLVMWLAIIGAVLACMLTCSYGGCGCCGDDCSCGDCEWCRDGDGHGHPPAGHEGQATLKV